MPGFSVPHSLSEFAQPMLYCSLQHQTFTTRHIHNWVSFLRWPSHFILSGAIRNCPPFFPSSMLDTYQPGGAASGVIYFCLFILFLGLSWQEYWSGMPFPAPVDHVLSELFAMTCPSWVALDGIAHSFTELHKPLCHDKAVICEEVLRLRGLSNLHKVTY